MLRGAAIRKGATAIPGYELLERIGEGGTAEVWRARHRLLGRDAAVKLLRTEDAASELMRERFKLEARAAAALRSPHAVEIYDVGTTDDGTLFLAMELLHGVDLQRLVEQFGPQEPSRTICLLEQTCDVLHEAHRHQMVHRDIKPANIFVTRRVDQGDFAKVVDFGLVRAIGCDREEPTTPLNMSGTLAFLPPEVVTAECVGECDVDLCVGMRCLLATDREARFRCPDADRHGRCSRHVRAITAVVGVRAVDSACARRLCA